MSVVMNTDGYDGMRRHYHKTQRYPEQKNSIESQRKANIISAANGGGFKLETQPPPENRGDIIGGFG